MADKVQKIDLVSPAFARDPFPTYAGLREAGAVFRTRLPLLGKAWVATTYQAASEVLKDDETFVMEAKKVGKTLFSGHQRAARLARRGPTEVHPVGPGAFSFGFSVRHAAGRARDSQVKAPARKERLLGDWSLLPLAVEELLRFVTPFQMSEARHVIRDLEFHGQPLRRGDAVVACLGAANSDPARFPDPDKLGLARSPNPHVSFGSGAHFCLGAQLARVEAQVGFERLFTRHPRLALAVADSELKYSGNMFLRALAALPVRLR
jgi:cytochrome P450